MALEFPFDAVVDSSEALVRSGPGERDYYPTLKLTRGVRVRVIRQELSGWYLIEPPEGSFSFVPAQFVQRRDNDMGLVTENTFDRIGSNVFSGPLTVVHNIPKGTVVKILGEETITIERGLEKVFRIAPPRLEYRYINSRDVVPAGDLQTPAPEILASPSPERPAASPAPSGGITFGPDVGPSLDTPALTPQSDLADGQSQKPAEPKPESLDPFAGASPGPEMVGQPLPDTASSGLKSPIGSEPALSAGPRAADRLPASALEGLNPPGSLPTDGEIERMPLRESQAVNDAWRRLDHADTQFRNMVKQPESSWDLPSLRTEYENIQQSAQHPSIDAQIEKRLAAVEKYSGIQRDYLDLRQILKSTEEKDAEIRESFASRWQSVSTQAASTTVVRPLDATSNNSAGAPPPPPADPFAESASSAGPAPGLLNQAAAPAPGRQPRFEGAGIIQRSAFNGRFGIRHVLLAPDGRVLAYLQAAPGVNLDAYLGREMGLNGPRAFRSDINADFMVVYRLSPVRIARPGR